MDCFPDIVVNCLKPQERGKRKWRESDGRQYNLLQGEMTNCRFLQVPRQCPLVLLANVVWTGHVVGSEEGEVEGGGLFHEERKQLEQGLYCVS
jgi:hypothetical protein